MKLGIRARMLGASVLLAAIIAAAFVLLLAVITDLRRSSDVAADSTAVIAAESHLDRLTVDLDAGVRAYVVTRDAGSLVPWRRALADLPRAESTLAGLVAGDSVQRRRADAISAAIRSYVADYARPLVQTAGRRPLSQIESAAAIEDGSRRIDAIRDQFGRLEDGEQALAAERDAHARSLARRATALAGVALGACSLLLLLFAAYSGTAVVAPLRRLARASKRLGGGDLTVRVDSGGAGELGELGRSFNEMASSLEESRSALAVEKAEAERLAQINGAVLDATQDGILLINADGSPDLANRAMQEMFADLFIEARGSEGTFAERAEAFSKHTADPAAYLETIEAIARDPEYRGESEFGLESGRWVRRYTTPVHGALGELIGRLLIFRETTKEREAEQLKSDLVATVSHELRSPLAGVLGFAELLTTRDLDDETSRRYLKTIHDEARRLTDLINDFLDIQRIEAQGLSLTIAPVDLGALLRRAAAASERESHPVHLDLDGVPAVAGDGDRLVQVVQNLLSNAIKYSPGGGPVEVTAEAAGGFVRVSVLDRGLGIPARDHGRIFGKFFRVDSTDTRRIGGTGLGLALSREIVEAHGGRMGFESVEGEGSTFWFELPAADAAAVGGTGPAALIVEDNPAAAQLLTEYLVEAGCSVTVVATGEGALAAVAAAPPALVCLDIVLAGSLDGWQVLSALKSDAATASIPVIVCTARNGREHASALGASDFLTKPFPADQLRAAIERLLPAKRGTVLVVDDEVSVRRLVVESLSGNGFAFVEAEDGEAALAAIARATPDAIVLDLIMPRLDGFGVLRKLHDRPATRAIPVIVLTGRALSAADRRLLQLRTVSLLEKSGYSAGALRALVERALVQRPAA